MANYPTPMEGEPTFELMARDPFAPALVRLWASARRLDVRNGIRPVSDLDQIERAERTAERMEDWRRDAEESWRDQPSLDLRPKEDVVTSWSACTSCGERYPSAPPGVLHKCGKCSGGMCAPITDVDGTLYTPGEPHGLPVGEEDWFAWGEPIASSLPNGPLSPEGKRIEIELASGARARGKVRDFEWTHVPNSLSNIERWRLA